MKFQNSSLISVVSVVEILIGITTLCGVTMNLVFFSLAKPPVILIIVYLSAAVSLVLGVGLLKRKEWARFYLVYFSGYIVISKIMIFCGVLHFTGEIITAIPTVVKDSVSLAYHLGLIGFLTRHRVKSFFK